MSNSKALGIGVGVGLFGLLTAGLAWWARGQSGDENDDEDDDRLDVLPVLYPGDEPPESARVQAALLILTEAVLEPIAQVLGGLPKVVRAWDPNAGGPLGEYHRTGQAVTLLIGGDVVEAGMALTSSKLPLELVAADDSTGELTLVVDPDLKDDRTAYFLNLTPGAGFPGMPS